MFGRKRARRPRGGAANAVFAAILILAAAGVVATAVFGITASVSGIHILPREFRIAGNPERNREMSESYFLFLRHSADGNQPDSLRRFIAARRIGAILIDKGEYAKAAAFLTKAAAEEDAYAAWYIFSAAGAYEADGAPSLAVPLYERMVKMYPDLEIEGESLHYEALSRLAGSASSPEKRIGYYRDLIARFPDRPDPGVAYYLLALEYEKTGEWDLAVQNYSKFLPWFGTEVPGHPDALKRARTVVEFNSSPKDWGYENLAELVAGIKSALVSRSSSRLRRYMAKVGFFAVSWHQDGVADANSRVLFDFSEFMRSGAISVAEGLDSSSGATEAYLRTWGWTGRVQVWYLYFRKIDFPADPKVHGQWEWAGIYFGEKMQ